MNYGHGIGAAVGHVQVTAIGRPGHAVRAASLKATVVGENGFWRGRANLLDDLVCLGIYHRHGVAAGFRYVETRFLGIERDARWLPFQANALGNRWRIRGYIHDHDFAVACARNEGGRAALDGHPHWILSSWHAV